MSRIVVLLCAFGLALTAVPAPAQNPKPAKKADPTERCLEVLASELVLKEGENPNEVSLSEICQELGKRYDANFSINEDCFKSLGRQNIREEKPNVTATALRGVTVHQFLSTALEGMGGTYLVRNGSIEIVSVQYAAKVTKSGLREEEDGRPRLNEPLVSAVVKEKPLNEVVAKIAEMYDLTVVVSPQAGDAKTGFVTARLLNLPADKVLDILALQCDLRVVRRGTAYLLTNRDHANDLHNEKMERERQKIELDKFRAAPFPFPMPPAPAPGPAPGPAPAPAPKM
jgi:hypothetical protein